MYISCTLNRIIIYMYTYSELVQIMLNADGQHNIDPTLFDYSPFISDSVAFVYSYYSIYRFLGWISNRLFRLNFSFERNMTLSRMIIIKLGKSHECILYNTFSMYTVYINRHTRGQIHTICIITWFIKVRLLTRKKITPEQVIHECVLQYLLLYIPNLTQPNHRERLKRQYLIIQTTIFIINYYFRRNYYYRAKFYKKIYIIMFRI